jgi:hypothetical protein
MRITHPDEVASEAVRRGADKWFHERLRTLAGRAMCIKGRPNGDHVNSPVVAMRVANRWPMRGSVMLTLENDQRFRLYATKGRGLRFKVKEVN